MKWRNRGIEFALSPAEHECEQQFGLKVDVIPAAEKLTYLVDEYNIKCLNRLGKQV